MDELRNFEKIIDFFLENTENLRMLSFAECRDVLQLASTVAAGGGDDLYRSKGYELLYKCCFLMDLDIKELWNIYNLLNHALFANCNLKISGNLDELYRLIFQKVLGLVTDSYERIENPDSNLVIMTTDQFLGVGHAPTRRILDYTYTIATELHKQVMIINDSGLNFYPCACLKQDFFPNYIIENNRRQYIQYKDLIIPFMQIPTYMPDMYCINEMLRKIYSLQPELVYNIGGSSLLSDLCTLFTKTASFPCSTGIPVTMSQHLLVGRMINESDAARLQRLEPYQQVIETVVNYQLPTSSNVEYMRSQFGLKEDDFVIGIVGNRLDIEIDDKFIEVIHEILNRYLVKFLVVGSVDDKEKITANLSDAERIHFAGSLPEASQAMKLFDIYCNPTRNGGGRSSFEALANGVPVLTMKQGDVYYTCGEEFGVEDYEEYINNVGRYTIDKEYIAAMKEKAFARADYLSDLTKTQGDILKKIL